MTPATEYISAFNGFDLETDKPLARYTSFRVGGPADLLARPDTIDSLVSLVKTAQKAKVPVTVLGGGTNTLVSDRGIRGLVIVMAGLKAAPEFSKAGDTEVTLAALAGQRLSTLCRLAVEKGLSGLEWAAGIPGTLGGALMMNAGAHGGDMAAVTRETDVLDLNTLTIKTLGQNDLETGYRTLDLPDSIILKAALRLIPADPEQVREEHDRNLKAKKASQPVSKASGGCFFKNPSPDRPAGMLIEQAGLKGTKLNGAMVSDLHANFIINYDNAGCKDILALKQLVQDRVYKKFNVKLKAEVKAIGD
ncbi:MAG: UDP-N-acetylmuramate dehydrogenase [Desulfobacterales bacterium]|nr:UDP-N-acetylmuramate dehydrogenase [Desulfobacterales bacterium]